VIYRYERDWSQRAQNNLLWRFVKLLYTQLTLQYLGASFMVGPWCSDCMSVFVCWDLCHAVHALHGCMASICCSHAVQVLHFNSSFAVWRSVHFFGHLAIAGA
jgi:hypothetical protein